MADNSFELEKIHESLDWLNLMTYDYSGDWDNYTGIDAPLYGRYQEGFPDHPKYKFNVHETVQHYLSKGVPASKLSLGVHTENKGWILR